MKRFSFVCIGLSVLTSPLAAQSVTDPDLKVQTYVKGLSSPTGIAFVNESTGEALITQKLDGKVIHIKNRQIVGTALDLPVDGSSERGLLSIALSPSFATDQRVFLYHTVAPADGQPGTVNRISRYRWNGTNLVFDKNIIDLPIGGPNHDGGKIAFDSKGKLLTIIGDTKKKEVTQNVETSTTIRRTGAIIRIERSGARILTNPFAGPAGAARTAKDDIFAYGIRNSFGLAVDPVTGNIWDTENGGDKFDEINRIEAGFNSGWLDISGPKSRNGGTTGTLVSLGPRAKYSDPEFSWAATVAPTDLHFFNSSRLGSQYENDLFVGDVNTGSIFHFDLSGDRKSLALSGGLADLVADNTTTDRLAEQDDIVFGNGFGIVTDLLNGPGGLFALSLTNGRLYRITSNPVVTGQSVHLNAVPVPEPAGGLVTLLLAAQLLLPRRHSGRASRKSLP